MHFAFKRLGFWRIADFLSIPTVSLMVMVVSGVAGGGIQASPFDQ